VAIDSNGRYHRDSQNEFEHLPDGRVKRKNPVQNSTTVSSDREVRRNQTNSYSGSVPTYMQSRGSFKNTTAALVLCVYLGFLGGHKFYLGRWKMGIVYLLTFGLFGIGILVDLFNIAYGKAEDSKGFRLNESKGGKIVAWLMLIWTIFVIGVSIYASSTGSSLGELIQNIFFHK